jgi:hypothetical protein
MMLWSAEEEQSSSVRHPCNSRSRTCGAMRVTQLDASRLDAEYGSILVAQVSDALASAPAGFRRAVVVCYLLLTLHSEALACMKYQQAV